jgi:short-subunit dehydrogenase
MTPTSAAIIIGNSDGIGLALTRKLLEFGWAVRGLSRSATDIDHPNYDHTVIDVTSSAYPDVLTRTIQPLPNLCVYCAGIGEVLDPDNLASQRQVFEVNLMAAIRTIEIVLPPMLARKSGHIIVLTSIADVLLFDQAPSYPASKAGLSSYLEGLGMALGSQGVAITNLRFGFVDTKMAKGDHKPFMMTVDKAVEHIQVCLRKRPLRYTRPRIMGILAALVSLWNRIRL